MYTARYAADDNSEVLCLRTELQITENLPLGLELDPLPFEWCLN